MAPYSLQQLTMYFLRLGTIGFGGPVALVGYMHRDLVEKKQWFAEEDYKEGLALAQLAPGPLLTILVLLKYKKSRAIYYYCCCHCRTADQCIFTLIVLVIIYNQRTL